MKVAPVALTRTAAASAARPLASSSRIVFLKPALPAPTKGPQENSRGTGMPPLRSSFRRHRSRCRRDRRPRERSSRHAGDRAATPRASASSALSGGRWTCMSIRPGRAKHPAKSCEAWAGRVHDRRNRAVRRPRGSRWAPALHRIDHGDAAELKAAFCREGRRRRPAQTETGEHAHGEPLPSSRVQDEYEDIFILTTI